MISKYRKPKADEGNVEGISDDAFRDAKRPASRTYRSGSTSVSSELALRQGVATIFVLTEPRLAAHFGKLGVKVTQIGGPVEHRGQRIPSMMDPKDIVDGLSFVKGPLYKVVAAEVERGRDMQVAAKASR